eukprot:13271656-Alexandrium_andersonii.AAC.1
MRPPRSRTCLRLRKKATTFGRRRALRGRPAILPVRLPPAAVRQKGAGRVQRAKARFQTKLHAAPRLSAPDARARARQGAPKARPLAGRGCRAAGTGSSCFAVARASRQRHG